ncbi:ABC transporter ATP-binding protein [Albibacterium indicum]|uniref:ABC transporter ATP-binding protein n=1 Tax=Albibacterium indicum TaxID=2292082 RepID=UPI000E4B33C6|nr:ATP-binding cassette domain-containing protein [Pedobacter indicus]
MIELKNISKVYNKGKPNEVTALRQIDLNIKAKDFVTIVGSNGSGKSTLLNIIAGSIPSSTGTIRINGTDVSRLPEYKRSKWLARVFQDPLQGTAGGLNILENFRLAALRSSSKKLAIGLNKDFVKTVEEKVAALGLGLENKLEQSMGSLSGGQRQALSLLMSVMADLDILLLDEPTAALDPRSAATVLRLTDQLVQEYGITAVMVTHNMKEAHQYGKRLLVMKEGEVFQDISGETKKQLELTDMYDWFA